MKSFSVNLTEAEWQELAHLLLVEIDVLRHFMSKRIEENWSGWSDSDKERFEDYFLRIRSSLKKICKKLDENA